jgi:hypothetical protein
LARQRDRHVSKRVAVYDPVQHHDDLGTGVLCATDRRAVVPGKSQLRALAQPGGVHESACRDDDRAGDLSPLGGSPTQVLAPDFKRIDVSVFKRFRASGNQRFELRAEVFNVTKVRNFSAPGFSGGGAGLPPPPGVLDFSNTAIFGRITALRFGPNDQRQIQLALEYYF